jgi:endonuclease G, mitochondrial
LPRPTDPGIETTVLPYTNFAVVFRPDRRLAAATAVTIDGGQLVDALREDEWRFDPRLPEAQQADHLIYKDNPLDKGHLVRRLDPVWGREASAANSDTFHYTNAAPQMDIFNQGKQLWQGLENFLLDHAEQFDRKLTVFTGPVLEDSDRPTAVSRYRCTSGKSPRSCKTGILPPPPTYSTRAPTSPKTQPPKP